MPSTNFEVGTNNGESNLTMAYFYPGVSPMITQPKLMSIGSSLRLSSVPQSGSLELGTTSFILKVSASSSTIPWSAIA